MLRGSEQTVVVVPPDGGWGWMVVLGSWTINLVVFGFFRAGGIVLLACVAHFGNSRSVVAWIPVLTVGLCFFMAPLSGVLVKRYAYRQVVFIGGMVCTTGLVLCHYATRIEYMFLGYGVVLGIGFGLVLGPNLAIVGLYFQRHRALATGISFSGGAVGTFLVGPLVEFLIEEYGLKGAFLILSAFLLHVCVAATLFRPIEEYYTCREGGRGDSSSYPNSCSSTNNNSPTSVRRSTFLGNSLKSESIPMIYVDSKECCANAANGDAIEMVDGGSVGSNNVDGIEINGNNFDFNLKRMTQGSRTGLLTVDDELQNLKDLAMCALYANHNGNHQMIPKIIVTSADGEAWCPSLRGSVEVLNNELHPAAVANYGLPRLLEADEPAGLCDDACDVALLTNKLLFLTAFGYGLTMSVYVAVMVILPDHVQNSVSGMTKMDGVICVSSASAGDLIGRIGVGWIVDKLANKKRFLYQASFFCFGFVVLLLPLACCYSVLVGMCLIMGLFFGVCLVHSPCFLAEYVGVAKLPLAMGYMLALAGVPTIALGPVIGGIRDSTGNYNASLWTMGSMLLVGATTWFFQPVIYSHQKRVDRERDENCMTPVKV